MKILFTLMVLLVSSLIYCQSNADSLILKYHIKEVRILDSEDNITCITKYDTLGRLVFNALDNFQGSTFLKTSSTIIYNDKGKVIKTISTHSSYADPTIWIYEYDSNGNKTAIKTQEGNPVFQFVYDDSNYLIKELAFGENHAIRQTTTYEKFEGEKKTVAKITGNIIKDRTSITYFDEHGNEIRSESYDDQKLYFSTNKKYDKNRLTKIVYNSDYGDNYFYTAKGLLSKRQQFKIENKAEVVGNFEEFTYDSKGLIKTYKENIYSGRKIRKYKYHYEFYN